MHCLLFLSYAFSGLLFIMLATPLIEQRVKPNPFYGFRTPKTLSDTHIWYKANAYSGRTLRKAGVLILLAAIFGLPLTIIPGIGYSLYTSIWFLTFTVSLLWSVIQSFRYLSTL